MNKLNTSRDNIFSKIIPHQFWSESLDWLVLTIKTKITKCRASMLIHEHIVICRIKVIYVILIHIIFHLIAMWRHSSIIIMTPVMPVEGACGGGRSCSVNKYMFLQPLYITMTPFACTFMWTVTNCDMLWAWMDRICWMRVGYSHDH